MRQQEKYDWMVYVSCMTFNHAPYIVDAMNGFTMQETNFPFVCAIVDDASTDGEQEIIKQYLNEHFDLEDNSITRHEETDDYVLTFVRHKTNLNCYFAVLYLKYNHYSIKKPKVPYLAQWRDNAKYIALCEGDDYWIVPYKLQKQIDFLDRNPEYGVCHTGFECYIQSSGVKKSIEKKCVDGWVTKELLKEDFYIATLTSVYRASAFREIDKSYMQQNFMMGDFPLWIELSRVSKIKYLPEKTACYRILKESASHSSSRLKQALFRLNTYEVIDYFIDKYSIWEISEDNKRNLYYSKSIIYALQRKFYLAFTFFLKSHKYNIHSIMIFISRFFLMP